jgi:hypothetical protein
LGVASVGLLILVGAGLVVFECVRELCVVGWTPHVSEEGGFSVWLPKDAFTRKVKWRRETKSNVGPHGPYIFEGVIFADGTRAGVFYFDLPSPAADPADLVGVMRFLARQYHGDITLKREDEINLGGYVGWETVFEHQKGARSVPVYGRWYLVGNRIYEVAWMPARDESSEEARDILWESFQLLEPDLPQVLGSR